MLRRSWIPASVLFLAAIVAAGQEQFHSGVGSMSCGQFVTARREKSDANSMLRGMMVSWVQGFLVGTAMASTGERIAKELGATTELSDEAMMEFGRKKFGTRSGYLFDMPDSDAVTVWLENYCSTNPLKTVHEAAAGLAAQLADESPTGKKAAKQPPPKP
jgi:hypothetical protein